jgi:hypothetical protein
MRLLLLAQGTGSRWDFRGRPFLDAPKQLVKIDGETLVSRARRLFLSAGCEVIVIGPKDERFGETVTLENPYPSGTEQDKFYATKHLWSETQRTIIAWADCYYTEDAVEAIVTHPSDDLHYFRRPTASKTTGHKWDESFAVSFGPHEHQRVISLADVVVKAVKSGKVKKDHIRTHYAASLGLPLDAPARIIRSQGQTVIDDWTDDFDRPEEWARWVGRYYNGKIKVGLASLWRPMRGQRTNAKDYVESHYSPVGKIVYGTAPGKHFNRSAARNAAINNVFACPETEVAFVVDADTFVSHEQLWAACYLAKITGTMVLAFDTYHRLDALVSDRVLRGGEPNDGRVVEHHASGAYAIPRALWEKIGGYDERFGSWGGEDRAFWVACNAMAGRSRSYRVPGKAYHLYHPISAERNSHLPEYQANIELAKRYKEAAGVSVRTGVVPEVKTSGISKRKLMAILKEPGAPLNMESIGQIIEETSLAPKKPVTPKIGDRYVLLKSTNRGAKGSLVVIEPSNVSQLQRLGVIGGSPHTES